MNNALWLYYLAGIAHALGIVIIAGWAGSHFSESLAGVFGPLGWLPAPIGLFLLLIGVRLLSQGGTALV
jgi:hypothetical protein